ncbi:14484_t:CDS:2, partial [Acaulospora morrowiae]
YRTSDSSVSPETNHNSEQINLRCEDTPASDITGDTSNSDICQGTKIQLEKFMVEVSKNSSSSINNSNADSNVIPTTQNETEESKTRCFASSQPSNISFTFLYEKLCNAIIFADRKTQEAIFCYEKQVDPESNAVSRILNKEVRAQLPANISDALLWKRIEKAKKLYKLFSIIDNVTFDYSIKIEPTLKSEFPEPSSGSDQQISCEKENKDSEFLETEVSTTFIPSVPLFHTSNSEDMMSEDNKSLPEEEVSISTGAISKDKPETVNEDNNISEKAEYLLEEEENKDLKYHIFYLELANTRNSVSVYRHVRERGDIQLWKIEEDITPLEEAVNDVFNQYRNAPAQGLSEINVNQPFCKNVVSEIVNQVERNDLLVVGDNGGRREDEVFPDIIIVPVGFYAKLTKNPPDLSKGLGWE